MPNLLLLLPKLDCWVAFQLYLQTLPWQFEAKQIRMMWKQITLRKSAKIQSRRTGKTLCNVVVLVFIALYFPYNSKYSAYFVNTQDQTKQVELYLLQHPWVKKKTAELFIVADRMIYLNCLTLNTAQSHTFDHVIFDECGTMIGKENLIFLAKITIRNNRASRCSYVGTPWFCSPFETIWNECKRINAAFEFHYKEVEGDWLDKVGIEEDRLTMDPRVFAMQYDNKWEAPGGVVFSGLTSHTLLPDVEIEGIKMQSGFNVVSVDQNPRTEAQYTCVFALVNDRQVVVKGECSWNRYQLLKFQRENVHVRVVLEDCGTNNGYIDWFESDGLVFETDPADTKWHEKKLVEFFKREIIMDERLTPLTWKHVKEQQWLESKDEMDKKFKNHYSDAFFHLVKPEIMWS